MTPSDRQPIRDRTTPMVSVADVIRARVVLGADCLRPLASNLGFEWVEPEETLTKVSLVTPPRRKGIEKPVARTLRLEPVPMIRPDRFFLRASVATDGPVASLPSGRRPLLRLITATEVLAEKVRMGLHSHVTGRAVDERAAIGALARLEALDRLPRKRRVARSRRWLLVVDLDPLLSPLWEEMEFLADHFESCAEGRPLAVLRVAPNTSPLTVVTRHEEFVDGVDVVALTDLGGSSGGKRQRAWATLGQRIRRQGWRAVALVPAQSRVGAEAWDVNPWTSFRHSEALIGEAIRRVMPLVAGLCRVDRGLVRDLLIRLGYPSPLAIELEIERMVGGARYCSPEEVPLSPAERAKWLTRLSQSTSEDRSILLELLPLWRGWLRSEIWSTDVLTLASVWPDEGFPTEWIRAATQVIDGITTRAQTRSPEQTDYRRDVAEYLARHGQRIRGPLWNERLPWGALARAWREVQPELEGRQPPLGPGVGGTAARVVRSRDVAGDHLVTSFSVPILHHGATIAGLDTVRFRGASGSFVAILPDGRVQISVDDTGTATRSLPLLSSGFVDLSPRLRSGGSLTMQTDSSELHCSIITREPWQKALWRDRYGLACTSAIAGVDCTFRWIPPGVFLMGTSLEEQRAAFELAKRATKDAEESWFTREGPRHEVVISRGFWLGETPVTQALWTAVMGENPSRFDSPDRPVEQVSWDTVQDFLTRANDGIKGPNLRLPYECEWEHACRAGIDTATYAGPIEYTSIFDAPVLEEIAWYGGNSNHNFDLKNGYDCSSWKERSHPDGTQAGTRKVRLKTRNPWGLYDMLGNVYEWCQDGLREYTAERITDPIGKADGEAPRVCRGGAWFSFAFLVRAGCRGAGVPSIDWFVYGFRLARGPFGRTSQDRAEPDQE